VLSLRWADRSRSIRAGRPREQAMVRRIRGARSAARLIAIPFAQSSLPGRPPRGGAGRRCHSGAAPGGACRPGPSSVFGRAA
jgi:hypothetical protein